MLRKLRVLGAVGLCLVILGALGGGIVGVFAPNFLLEWFQVRDRQAFHPVEVGVGMGVILGGLAAALGIAGGVTVGLVAGEIRPRLWRARSLQPTFAGLLVLLALVALGLASLKNPTVIGVRIWFVATVLALAWAGLATITSPAEHRGFAAGFLIVGGGYLGLSLIEAARAQLPTTPVLAFLERQISGFYRLGVQSLTLEMGPFPARGPGAWAPVVTSLGGIPGHLSIEDPAPEFRNIGHSVLALSFGLVGGLIAEVRQHRLARSG